MTHAKYRNVFFDVDSTLVTIEGIDVLGRGDSAIARLTEAAMNGEVPVDEVYARRLDLIRPTRVEVDALARQYLVSLVEGAEDGIARLREAGAQVHLVTAGIAQAIDPLAARLEIPQRAVHAVALRFDDAGNYVDFDRTSPLTRSGGKATVVRDVRARAKGNAAFVGDGVTDLEAKAAVDCFIGFGGVHVRPRVKDNADVYTTDFRDVVSHLIE